MPIVDYCGKFLSGPWKENTLEILFIPPTPGNEKESKGESWGIETDLSCELEIKLKNNNGNGN